VLEQMKADFAKNEKMVNAAKANDHSLFKVLYEKNFIDVAMNRYEEIDSFFTSLFTDEAELVFVKDMRQDIPFKAKLNQGTQLIFLNI
jgi:type I restriction enzyme, R subunit